LRGASEDHPARPLRVLTLTTPTVLLACARWGAPVSATHSGRAGKPSVAGAGEEKEPTRRPQGAVPAKPETAGSNITVPLVDLDATKEKEKTNKL
jgi:hypothetical protein